MDTNDKEQLFFDNHSDDIVSFYQNKSNRDILYTS